MQKRKAFPRKKGYIVALLLLALVTAAFFVMMILTDLLPSDLTVILAGVVVALLLLTNFMFSSRFRWKRIVGILISMVLICVLASVTVFMGETYAMLNSISGSSAGSADASGPDADKVSVTEEPFNIYITGIDQWESEKGLDLERSDVNMIVTVNPVTKKVLLTSIPRDSYVKLHTAQQMDKLTHTGVYGVDETIYTVEDWLGVDLNYYVKMNFSAAVEIIDALGGIKVYSPVEFESSLKGYKYKKGWNYLGGYKALYFARERHAFEGQDSIRVENQQRVVKAIIKKMTSSTALLTNYGDVMSAASRNMHTNMSSAEMTELAKMQLTDLSEWDVQSQKIDGEYGEDYVASLTQSQKFSVFNTDPASEKKCTDAISNVMNPSQSEINAATENSRKGFIMNALYRVQEKVKEKAQHSEEEG
ncbi:MAG: LCP family protein [Mogibacterium sp.]|nr:LCP family protein [Mogibacterium sp.]